jgi:ABC-2 type transport system ATP-binding protein
MPVICVQGKNMSEAVIQLDNVHKYYGRLHALRGVNLQVNRGEIFGFLGPNGAGKTTTIRCMLDLIRPNHGNIRIFGDDPQRFPQKVKRQVSYLPGDLKMDGDFTARGYLDYLRRLRQGGNDWPLALKLAERLQLPLDQKIKTLSQGNRQKVGLIHCLMNRAPLLLLDEPTLGLDPLMKQEVLRLIREIKSEGATVFFSSHILSEVQEIADRVGIIRKGALVEIASTRDLINRSLTRAMVQFHHPVQERNFSGLANIQILRVNGEGRTFTFEVAGGMDLFIKTLARYEVANMEISRPSLEEIFLKYYQNEGKEE